MWDLPGPGLEPVSPALAGGFLTTAPPGKPNPCDFDVGSVIMKTGTVATYFDMHCKIPENIAHV